jgi:hypothetical protein
VTSVNEPSDNLYFSATAHRALWIASLLLVALGFLAWFLLGANRPLDPVVSQGLVLVPLAARRILS